ncbi:MAG: hypothetical protein LUE89_09495 [Clostridiales bacterium]|nr:hypothetical protein [Clostridiales bacterium]
MQTLRIIAADGNMLLTHDYRFLSGNPDSPFVTDCETGEILEVLGCTTDIHGKLESIDID